MSDMGQEDTSRSDRPDDEEKDDQTRSKPPEKPNQPVEGGQGEGYGGPQGDKSAEDEQ
jgi:hypothetical protein